MGKLMVVVGGQFGSEGKGALAAYLSKQTAGPLVAVRVAGPNAGHTAIGTNGKTYKLRQIPVAAVTNPDADLVIAAGSEVDAQVLENEIEMLETDGYFPLDRLHVDIEATVIAAEHQEREQQLVFGIGSTGKGIGAARADRIMRRASLWGYSFAFQANTARMLTSHLKHNGDVLIEGTQGYGLGLHAGFYPHCTSSDCRAIDFLAMAGISPWTAGAELEVWMAVRTHPIRVAGPSGPLEYETDWGKLGLPPEYTTVTNKVRRVGEWDSELVRNALTANGMDAGGSSRGNVALMMWDYWFPRMRNSTNPYDLYDSEAGDKLREVQKSIDYPIRLLGTGPDTVIEVPEDLQQL